MLEQGSVTSENQYPQNFSAEKPTTEVHMITRKWVDTTLIYTQSLSRSKRQNDVKCLLGCRVGFSFIRYRLCIHYTQELIFDDFICLAHLSIIIILSARGTEKQHITFYPNLVNSSSF